MGEKTKDDVVLVASARTAVGNYGGSLKSFLGIDLAVPVIKEVVKRAGIEEIKNQIGDVIMGQLYYRNKEEPNVGRLAAWHAGLGQEVPGLTMQRACSVGLQAIITGAHEIIADMCDMVIAGGTESMTNAPYELYNLRWGRRWLNEELFDGMYAPILNCPPTGTGMGVTAENLADMFNITREEMEEWAVTTHQRAAKATEEGKFAADIIPLEIPPKRKGDQPQVFDRDECIRPDTSVERLRKLPPTFKESGKVTAGTSCPLNDGAGVVMLMRRSKADELGIKPLAKFAGATVVGVDPDIMGYGPTAATKRLFARKGLKASDVDLYQLHEPFAPIPLVFMKEIGVPKDIFNVNGSSLAIGHPIGATGAILAMILVREMQRRDAKVGLVGLCQGTGMGTVALWEKE